MCGYVGLKGFSLYSRDDVLRPEGIEDPEKHSQRQRYRRLVDFERMLECYAEIADKEQNDQCGNHGFFR